MPGGESVYFAFGAILAIASTALMAAAIASPDWYEIHSGSLHQRVGYFEFCNTSGGPIPSEDCFAAPFDVAFCGHESGLMKARQGAGAALGLLGATLMLVVCVLLFVGWWFRDFTRCVTITSIVLSAVALAGYWVAIIIICIFFEKWYYCETDYCTYAFTNLGATDCSFFHGYSFVYGIIAAILAALVICLLVGLFLHSDPRASQEDKEVNSEERKRLNSRDRGEDPGKSSPRLQKRSKSDEDDFANTTSKSTRSNNNRSISAQSNHAPDFSTSPQSVVNQNQSKKYRSNSSTVRMDNESISHISPNASTGTNRRLHLDDEINGRHNSYDLNNAPPLPRSRSKLWTDGNASPTRNNRLPPTADSEKRDYLARRSGSNRVDEEEEDLAFAPAPADKIRSRSNNNARQSSRSSHNVDDEDENGDNSVMLSNLTRRSGSQSSRHQGRRGEGAHDDTEFTIPTTDDAAADGRLTQWPTDWVYHSQSQLYWSASQQLYLDPKSEHYLDPHSSQWYDPKRDVWYRAKE